MDGKFMGVGLGNLLGIAIFVILVILVSKVVFTKYEVPGVSQAVQAI